MWHIMDKYGSVPRITLLKMLIFFIVTEKVFLASLDTIIESDLMKIVYKNR